VRNYVDRAGRKYVCMRSLPMFDFIWIALISALFSVGLVYLVACERM